MYNTQKDGFISCVCASLSHDLSHAIREVHLCVGLALPPPVWTQRTVLQGWFGDLEQQWCHSGAFTPSLSEKQRDGENMDEHRENDIKATGLCLYENGPLWAESHARLFVIPVLKKQQKTGYCSSVAFFPRFFSIVCWWWDRILLTFLAFSKMRKWINKIISKLVLS